ncbi:MAG: hypothetical protein JWO86_6689 [Myxococcaceae bacterium]|nr:hypothetical protein [Myxococcaceae bacterium]
MRASAPDGPDLDLAAEARRMRERFEKRTGAFGPEDAWFEPRSRAFWDDALTTQGFARLAAPHAGPEVAGVVARFERAHRGVFLVEDVDDRGARLVDLWSGAELIVRHLDEAQAVTLEHAEGPMDARVVAGPASEVEPNEVASLYVLPGALHHGSDALEPLVKVIAAAREREMATGDVLDALLRMELVFRSSSRVKAAFAYRVESLPRVPRPVL